MKKITLISFLSLFYFSLSATTGPNLITTNPGFEDDAAPQGTIFIPTGWLTEAGGNIYVELLDNFNEPPSDPEHGSYALKMFGSFTGGFNQTLVFQNTIPATTGESYDACIEMYVSSLDPISGGNQGFMRLAFFDGGGNEIGGMNTDFMDAASPQDAWQNLCVTMEAPAGTASMGMFLFFLQPGFDGGAIFYDNASICVTAPIPTMQTWGLIILGLCLSIFGIISILQVNTKFSFIVSK